MSSGLARSLELLTSLFDRSGIPFMIAGSFASTYYGEPRSTQDVDIVIDPTRDALEKWFDALPADRVYADRQSGREALAHRDMFNIIDLETGWKADLIVRKSRPFSQIEFTRRVRLEWMGLSVLVATPEDVILSKLEWSRLSGGSERQLRDVAGMLESVGDRLDIAYIESWLDALRVRDSWEKLRSP